MAQIFIIYFEKLISQGGGVQGGINFLVASGHHFFLFIYLFFFIFFLFFLPCVSYLKIATIGFMNYF